MEGNGKFKYIREKMMSSECQRLLSELNLLNVELEESRYALHLLEMRYELKLADYKTFLGFEPSADVKAKLEEYRQELDDLGDNDETI